MVPILINIAYLPYLKLFVHIVESIKINLVSVELTYYMGQVFSYKTKFEPGGIFILYIEIINQHYYTFFFWCTLYIFYIRELVEELVEKRGEDEQLWGLRFCSYKI